MFCFLCTLGSVLCYTYICIYWIGKEFSTRFSVFSLLQQNDDALSNTFQCFTTLIVKKKKKFLLSNLNLLFYPLKPFPLFLSHLILLKSLSQNLYCYDFSNIVEIGLVITSSNSFRILECVRWMSMFLRSFHT